MKKYKVIHLTQGFVAIIDADDYRRVCKHSWRVTFGGRKKKYKDLPYAKTTIKGKGVYLHRFILNVTGENHVDHKNWQTLDCRKENLEEVTRVENMKRKRNVRKKG
jgi:hypothetical protein